MADSEEDSAMQVDQQQQAGSSSTQNEPILVDDEIDNIDDEFAENSEAEREAENNNPPVDVPESIQRRDKIEQQREHTLPEFLELMEDYRPVIPDSVSSYYLEKAGFVSDDIRVKRLVALAAQKFVADVARDAMQYCKSRMQNTPATTAKERKGTTKPDKRLVLTMEDLSAALGEYGVNANKPDYYI